MTLLLLGLLWLPPAHAYVPFNYYGDGSLNISGQKIKFRDKDQYLEGGLKLINQAFAAPTSPEYERLSLRLIEMLDYSQEKFANNGSLIIKSGYRSPVLNNKLRTQGKLAAQSSMHTEAGAVDAYFQGKKSAELFEQIKALNCCGIGYYGSQHFHLDVGPARYWNQETSKTEDKTPQLNEKIMVETEYDIYQAGHKVNLQVMRITHYPIDVFFHAQLLKPKHLGGTKLEIDFLQKEFDEFPACAQLDNRKESRQLQVRLPAKLPSGEYQIELQLCNKRNYKMPDTISSRIIKITN